LWTGARFVAIRAIPAKLIMHGWMDGQMDALTPIKAIFPRLRTNKNTPKKC
jgi:hypothetical protein